MIHVVIVAAIIVTFAAGLCGHACQPFPLLPVWRTVRARIRRQGCCTGAGDANSPSGGTLPAPQPLRPARARTRPLWAHSQPLDYDEAA